MEWKGQGEPATAADFEATAQMLNVEERVIRAIWMVEASGEPFRDDGSLTRRFEPHKLKKPVGNWRTSMNMSEKDRNAAFSKAYAADPEDAIRATSWGGPQIMGFNYADSGYTSARQMVTDFAKGEGQQLRAFARLIKAWGIDSALRAHDWLRFALRYNGNANGKAYATKIESAYRKLGGAPSPVVLRVGSSGEAVKRLQMALGIKVDGSFGDETRVEVIRFQEQMGLTPDGIVGAVTWQKLQGFTNVKPKVQETKRDTVATVGEYAAIGSTAAGAIATVGAALPESTMNLLIGFGGLGLIAFLGLTFYRRSRNV